MTRIRLFIGNWKALKVKRKIMGEIRETTAAARKVKTQSAKTTSSSSKSFRVASRSSRVKTVESIFHQVLGGRGGGATGKLRKKNFL